ncbi:MAG: hypothetical protein V4506_07650, partial [Bacteroidota bacterium]
FCLGLTLLFIYSCDPEKKTLGKIGRLTLPNEDVIDLDNNAVLESDGDAQMQLFEDSILIRPNTKISLKAEIIDTGAFRSLRDSAKKIDLNYSGSYILALKIIYGMNLTNKKMNLLYEPLFLKKTPTSNAKINAEYTVSSGSYTYKYDNNTSKFKQATSLGASTVYQDNIYIKRSGSGFGGFYYNNDQDSTGDVKEVVFSFQEIDSIIQGNPTTRKVYVLNAAEPLTINHKKYFKHILLLGPDDLAPPVGPIFYMKFGNLSHLCPPNCSTGKHYFNLK